MLIANADPYKVWELLKSGSLVIFYFNTADYTHIEMQMVKHADVVDWQREDEDTGDISQGQTAWIDFIKWFSRLWYEAFDRHIYLED